MSSHRSFAALLLVSVLSACGGKSFDAGELPNGGTDSGGTDAGGTDSGGTDSGGTASGGTGPVAGTDSGGSPIGGTGVGGGEAECQSYNDEAGTFIAVEIRNETFSAIHLGPTSQSCGSVPLFSVADATGKPLQQLSWCRFSCQSFVEQGGAGCPAVCPIWETISLQPGESFFTTWDGRYRVDALLPGRCVAGENPYAELMCDQAKVIRPGVFTFNAQAGTELQCSLSSMCPSCQADGQGGCKTSGTLIGGKLREAVAKVELNPRYGALKLPLPPCEADAPSGAAPPLTVTLVFTE